MANRRLLDPEFQDELRQERLEEEEYNLHDWEKRVDGRCPMLALGEDCRYGCDEEE